MRENLWNNPRRDASLLAYRSLRTWGAAWRSAGSRRLGNLFPSYVSGDEQCMRRAKWFPAGSSILAWMRHRDSAFQVGQPAGLRLTRISGPPCSRPTCSQTSLPTMPQGGSAATPSINGRVLVDRRAEREAVRSRHPSAARMLICGPGSRSWRRLPQSRPARSASVTPGSSQLSSSCLWLSGSGGQRSEPCLDADHFGCRGLFTIADGVVPGCSE